MSRSTLTAGAVALLIAGSLFSTLFGLGVKYVVDIIALGHSLAKTLLFLLFVFFLSLLVKWWPPVSARWSYRFAALLPVLFIGNLIQPRNGSVIGFAQLIEPNIGLLCDNNDIAHPVSIGCETSFRDGSAF